MNKRIRKKRALEELVLAMSDVLYAVSDLAEQNADDIVRMNKIIDANYQVMADNAKATNAELKRLERLIKKPWFKR